MAGAEIVDAVALGQAMMEEEAQQVLLEDLVLFL